GPARRSVWSLPRSPARPKAWKARGKLTSLTARYRGRFKGPLPARAAGQAADFAGVLASGLRHPAGGHLPRRREMTVANPDEVRAMNRAAVLRLALIGCVLAGFAPFRAGAQGYPTRPVTFLGPPSPGRRTA